MKLLKSFGYAFEGIKTALLEQANLRIHFFALAVVCSAGWYYSITPVEWCVVLLAVALVIGLELMNSALENLTDLVTKEQHPLAKKAKDMAAGAVLAASMMALIIGVIIFAKYV